MLCKLIRESPSGKLWSETTYWSVFIKETPRLLSVESSSNSDAPSGREVFWKSLSWSVC